MLTGKIRNDIDKLWEKFWTGGITNPLTVIEQISYLMFARMLDMQEDVAERKANRTGKPFDRLFPNTPEGQLLRWKNFRNMSGKELHSHLKQKVYPSSPNSASPKARAASVKALAISASTCRTPTWRSRTSPCLPPLWRWSTTCR